jgi:hypothetical protein
MSTSTILVFAIVVFLLLLVGLALSANEFIKISEDPSIAKGARLPTGDRSNLS